MVALKFIQKLGKSEAELRALQGEIAIMRDLRHDNIIALYDWLETDSEVRLKGVWLACDSISRCVL